MSWSDEKTLAFLRMYKERPLLWDPMDSGYKNKNKRHELLMELSVVFGTDKNEVEKKIRSLQSQFARERKKEKYSQVTGSGKDEPYISKWFGYKSMMFLVDKNKPKTTSTANNEVPENQEAIEAGDNKDNLKLQRTYEYETETKNSSSSKKLRKQFSFPKKHMPVNRKQRSYNDTKAPVLNEALNLMRSIQTNLEDKDEYTLFGEQVAVKLRKIPSPQARFTIQNIINKALFDGEMDMYSSNIPSNTTYENSSPPALSVAPQSPGSSSQSTIQSIKSESISEIDEQILSL